MIDDVRKCFGCDSTFESPIEMVDHLNEKLKILFSLVTAYEQMEIYCSDHKTLHKLSDLKQVDAENEQKEFHVVTTEYSCGSMIICYVKENLRL